MGLQSLKNLKLNRAERATAAALEREGMLGRILEIGQRLEPLFSGRDVWSLLSPPQREKVGQNFKEAYARHGTLGMWMRATKQPDRWLAVIELAELLLAALPGEIKQMKRVLDIKSESLDPEDLPNWDRNTGMLWFRGRLARKIARVGQARNVVLLLDVFQEDVWPKRIDDPLPAGKLGTTLNSLSKNLKFLEFHGDGTGKGLIWQEI